MTAAQSVARKSVRFTAADTDLFEHLRALASRIGEISGLVPCIVLMLSIVTAAGCGYQLRGTVSLPPDLATIHVTGPPEVGAALVQVLDGAGVRVHSTPDSAAVVVRLGDERFDRRVLSVDPDTGKETEFELAYKVAFQVNGADGEELVPRQTVSLLRDYRFDPAAVLATEHEQDTLHAEMRRDAAAQVVRRIEAALRR